MKGKEKEKEIETRLGWKGSLYYFNLRLSHDTLRFSSLPTKDNTTQAKIKSVFVKQKHFAYVD